jgi:hypothetical protein
MYIQTRPTGNAGCVVMATLQNDTGAEATSLTVGFDLSRPTGINGTEQVPGFRAYFSLTGDANTWQAVPGLTSDVAGALAATFSVGSWAPGAPLYLLWADDNATGTDYAYTIDNITFAAGTSTIPLSVALTTPLNGEVIFTPTSATATAVPAGTVPATSVSFYLDGSLVRTIPAPGPYTMVLSGMSLGTHTLYAQADNGVDPTATSATRTLLVREQYVRYIGGRTSEDFDGMGSTGTETPYGWFVGGAVPATSVIVTPNDGSTAPSASILGFNYGSPDAEDRALGTAPTGTDRETEVRILNLSGSNIVSFTVTYDGEAWRTHSTGLVEVITNYISYNNGGSWVQGPQSLNFTNPVTAPVSTAMDGNLESNRVAGITGTITPPTPISVGGVVRIRWHNHNDSGIDAGMAVDNFSFAGTEFSQYIFDAAITSPTEGQRVFGGCSGGSISLTVNATASSLVTNMSFQLDGGAVVQDNAAPFSQVYPVVNWGTHTVRAVATDSFGNQTNIVRTFVVAENSAPTIAITNTYAYGVTNGPGVAFAVGSCITNQLQVIDDGGVTNVDWYVNGTRRVSIPAANNFNVILLNDALAGTNHLFAVATDSCGLVVTSSVVSVLVTNPANATVIVPNGSTWRYFNTTSAPAVQGAIEWFQSGFDASAWAAGAGEIGGGDANHNADVNNPETTLIDIGASSRYLTVYFRHEFTVANPSRYNNLLVRLLRDDGAVVYLNGNPVYTNTMTAGPFSYTNTASAVTDDGIVYHVASVDPTNLVAGLNLLAVEVHQDSATSSDLSFDLMLWGEQSSGAVPNISIVNNGNGTSTLSWPNTGAFRVFQSANLATPLASWTQVGAGTLNAGTGRWELIINSATGHGFFDLRP